MLNRRTQARRARRSVRRDINNDTGQGSALREEKGAGKAFRQLSERVRKRIKKSVNVRSCDGYEAERRRHFPPPSRSIISFRYGRRKRFGKNSETLQRGFFVFFPFFVKGNCSPLGTSKQVTRFPAPRQAFWQKNKALLSVRPFAGSLVRRHFPGEALEHVFEITAGKHGCAFQFGGNPPPAHGMIYNFNNAHRRAPVSQLTKNSIDILA